MGRASPVSPAVDLVQRWTLQIGAFVLPLAFLPNIVDEFVLPKLLVARLLVLLLAGLWLIRSTRAGTLIWRRTPMDLPLLVFAGSAAISTVFAVNRNVALFGTYGRYEGLLTLLTYLALFWLSVQALSGQRDARILVRSLLASAYVISVLAILQSVLGSVAGGRQLGETAFSVPGFVRAQGTLANPNLLGAFLAMLLPLTAEEVVGARSPGTRLLALNLLAVMGLALALTFSRGAWVGAAVGLVMVVATRPPKQRMWAVGIAAVALLALGLVTIGLPNQGGVAFGQATLSRAASLLDPGGGSGATRIHIWQDTLALVASHPLIGYGPDTFGLVYPRFQTGNWTPGFLIDKAHADALQVAATQGLIGLAAYLWLMVAFLRAFWRGRHRAGATALLAGWVAYQIPTQINFSWFPAAAPFWIFAAAAVVTWIDVPVSHVVVLPRPTRILIGAATVGAVLVATVAGVVRPYAADASYLSGLAAAHIGDRFAAEHAVTEARQLAPEQSLYAAEAGNLALNLMGIDTPGVDPDWATAREDYQAATRLGTFYPATFRHLAAADLALGRRQEAIAAARQALELDRFDRLSQALVTELTATEPATTPPVSGGTPS